MGLTVCTTRKVANASVPSKCNQRLADAIRANDTFDEFYDRWNNNDKEWLYFYDQSTMNQYKLQDDKVVIAPGLIVYEKERPTQHSVSIDRENVMVEKE